jgi:hypothetical protein
MLIMDLDFLRNYRDELIRMNRKKRGRPYRIAESYVRFLAVIRYLFSLGYRQLEGLPYSSSDRLLMDKEEDSLFGRRFCELRS